MTLAAIIREAGLSNKDFPNASPIPVNLYDRKNREITDPDIHFVEPLFAKNEHSERRFTEMLEKLEAAPVSKLTVIIDENQVLVRGASPCTQRFSRLPPTSISFMDFMD